jgi:hypothetical protein
MIRALLVAAALALAAVQTGCGGEGDEGPAPTRAAAPAAPAASAPELSGTRLRSNPIHEVVLRDDRLEIAYITSRSSRLHSVDLRRTATGARVRIRVRAYRLEDTAATYRCVHVPLGAGPIAGTVVDAASGRRVREVEQLAPEPCPVRRAS